MDYKKRLNRQRPDAENWDLNNEEFIDICGDLNKELSMPLLITGSVFLIIFSLIILSHLCFISYRFYKKIRPLPKLKLLGTFVLSLSLLSIVTFLFIRYHYPFAADSLLHPEKIFGGEDRRKQPFLGLSESEFNRVAAFDSLTKNGIPEFSEKAISKIKNKNTRIALMILAQNEQQKFTLYRDKNEMKRIGKLSTEAIRCFHNFTDNLNLPFREIEKFDPPGRFEAVLIMDSVYFGLQDKVEPSAARCRELGFK